MLFFLGGSWSFMFFFCSTLYICCTSPMRLNKPKTKHTEHLGNRASSKAVLSAGEGKTESFSQTFTASWSCSPCFRYITSTLTTLSRKKAYDQCLHMIQAGFWSSGSYDYVKVSMKKGRQWPWERLELECTSYITTIYVKCKHHVFLFGIKSGMWRKCLAPNKKRMRKNHWFRLFRELRKIKWEFQVLQLGRVDLDIRHWTLGPKKLLGWMATWQASPGTAQTD